MRRRLKINHNLKNHLKNHLKLICMKSKFSLAIFSTLFFVLMGSMVITSCTKIGPEGPPGLDGADAVETCMTCHNFGETLLAKVGQYQNSAHASGANIIRNTNGCAHCHTSKGFRDFVHDGTLAAVTEPTAINCRTCHNIHETYTMDDYKLRENDPVTLLVSQQQYNHGSSNLCVNCHQARPVNPMPVKGGADITITNARWSPHYSTAANIFGGVGKGAVEIDGSMAYVNSAHTTMVTDGCVTCHMSTPVGYMAGGHQMNVKYGTAYNYNGCVGCHTNTAGLTTLMNTNRTLIQGLLKELETLILDQKLMNANGMFTVPLTLTANQAAAVYNYKLVYYDSSYGAHNFPYVRALLTNSIEAIKPAPGV
jgi:hypothetical protein